MVPHRHERYYAVPIAAVTARYAVKTKLFQRWPLPPGESYVPGHVFTEPAR